MKPEHEFAPYPSPFRVGCLRCPWPKDAHPKAPDDVSPEPEWEAEVIRAAADGLANPEAIIALARERTLPGPLRDFTARDYDTEGLEEGSDWSNYAVWAIRQDDAQVLAGNLDEETASQKRDLRLRALGHIVVAFTLTEQARAL